MNHWTFTTDRDTTPARTLVTDTETVPQPSHSHTARASHSRSAACSSDRSARAHPPGAVHRPPSRGTPRSRSRAASVVLCGPQSCGQLHAPPASLRGKRRPLENDVLENGPFQPPLRVPNLPAKCTHTQAHSRALCARAQAAAAARVQRLFERSPSHRASTMDLRRMVPDTNTPPAEPHGMKHGRRPR